MHLQALAETDRLTWNKVQQVKAKLHHLFVLYNEDHRPNHVMCYCPLFMRSILNTWDDPNTFQSVEGSPEYWKQEMLNRIPRNILKRYSWTISWQADLPIGTVFLKRKKRFQKGRTIISYSGSLCSKLLQLAAVVISMRTKTLYQDAPGMQSMPQLWQSLHQHWAKPTAAPDQEWNDDLVGFFNAVPRRDIVTAVKQLTQEFLHKFSCKVYLLTLRPARDIKASPEVEPPHSLNAAGLKTPHQSWRCPSRQVFSQQLADAVFKKKAPASEIKYLLCCLGFLC